MSLERVSAWSIASAKPERELGATVRLVITTTTEVGRVEAGEDASKIKKEFFIREDLIGKVIEWDGESYAFRFTKSVD